MILEILSQQQIGILFFVCVLCLIALYNLITMKRLGDIPANSNKPLVSILVPARNEADNIEGCLSSLLTQDYEPYHVIVLDDESQDSTPEILERLAKVNSRLEVLTGEPLPPGWMGKNWACHQLSQVAQGDVILFVDADTRHHPLMLEEAVATLSITQADLLSGIPQQILKSWGERLTLPVLPWAIFSFFPIHLIQRLPFSFLSIAVGQFMLFRRAAYMQIGGHAAVRCCVTEDFALARLIKQCRLRWEFVDLNGRVSCRMYHNIGQVLAGLSKNLFAAFGHNLPLFLFIWFWLAIVFIYPALSLGLYLFGIQLPDYSPGLALATVALSLTLWLMSGRLSRLPPAQVILYPVIIAVTWLIAVRSAWFHYTKHSIHWKGRALNASHRQVDP